MAAVPVLCVSATDDVEERIAFLEAGADDVIGRPFDARELEARVEALLLRFQRSRDLAPVVSTDGLTMHRARRTVAVYSPKGGVGTTTIADEHRASPLPRGGRTGSSSSTSPSSSAASRRTSTSTRSRPSPTSSATSAALREPELLRTYAMRHDSGLHVLAAPAGPEAADQRHAGPRRRRS